jgi:hypothetical protein
MKPVVALCLLFMLAAPGARPLQAEVLPLPIVRYEGVEAGTNNLLRLTLLNVQARFVEPEANLPNPCFFEFQAQRGARVLGAGRVLEQNGQVWGQGAVLAPAVGTVQTPQGEQAVKGVLLLPLEWGLIVPAQGEFFQACGATCVRFGVQAVFWEVGLPQPCFLVGSVEGSAGQQP